MFLVSSTNGWTTKLIVALQLTIWSAVSIVLLQKGIVSLQRRMLETSHIVGETDRSTGDLTIEHTTVSSARDAENEYDLDARSIQEQTIDENARVIIRISPELPLEEDRKRAGMSAIDSIEISTIDRGTSNSSWMENHLLEINERIGNHDVKNIRSEILSERIRDDVSGNVHGKKEDIARPVKLVLEPVSKEEEDRDARTEMGLDFVGNASPLLVPRGESAARTSSFDWKETGDQVAVDTSWRNRNGIEISHRVNTSGTAMAVTMIAIGTVMLLLGPSVLILRLLEDRRRAREPVIELSMREDSPPPRYEEAVLMSEAPRYSTLALDARVDIDKRSSPSCSPSPSPSLFSPDLPRIC